MKIKDFILRLHELDIDMEKEIIVQFGDLEKDNNKAYYVEDDQEGNLWLWLEDK